MSQLSTRLFINNIYNFYIHYNNIYVYIYKTYDIFVYGDSDFSQHIKTAELVWTEIF